jgi:peroxiredoxin 2/4
VQPGDDVIVPPAGSCRVAKERMGNKEEMHFYDWFFCSNILPEETTVLEK